VSKPVLIVMGSDSDLPVIRQAADVLAQFGVGCDLRVLSAHRVPQLVAELSAGAQPTCQA